MAGQRLGPIQRSEYSVPLIPSGLSSRTTQILPSISLRHGLSYAAFNKQVFAARH